MKKTLFLIATVSLLIGVIAMPTSAQKTTISYWGWIGPEDIAVYREFENQHPDIKVKESLISDEWASTSEKFLAAIAAGNAPDVSLQNRHQFKQWASRGPFYDLTDLIEKDGMTADDWYPVQWIESSWAGKQYALPWDTDTRFLYWNKELFKEVGLDPEVPPKTWDELAEFTVKLTKKDTKGNYEQQGFLPYYGNTWTWLYGWLNGGEFLDKEQKKCTSDDPRIVYALEWMVDFYDKYTGGMETAASFLQGFQTAAQNPFVTGKLAMQGNGNWNLSDFATFPDLEYGMSAMPIPNTESGVKTTWSCGGSIAISRDTKNPEAAWIFTKWLTGPGGYKARATAGMEIRAKEWKRQQLPGEPVFVPPLATNKAAVKMLEDEFVPLLPPKFQEEYRLSVDALNWTHGCGQEMGMVGLTYWNEMHAATEAALYHKMSAEEALIQCRDNVQKALDEAWKQVVTE